MYVCIYIYIYTHLQLHISYTQHIYQDVLYTEMERAQHDSLVGGGGTQGWRGLAGFGRGRDGKGTMGDCGEEKVTRDGTVEN